MYLGETLLIREEVSTPDGSAFTIASALLNVYNAAGDLVTGPVTAAIDDTDESAQVLSYPWSASAVGVYRAVFTAIIGTQTRLFAQDVGVRNRLTTGYPVGADLLDRIEALGILAGGAAVTLGLDDRIASAIADWETDTGHAPFLSASADSTRAFDPPRNSCRLELDTGLASLTSVSVSGSALTLGTGFETYPANAAAKGQPITAIEFGYPLSGLARSVSIVGKWGYATSLPAAAREAILTRAMILCHPDLALGISRGLYSIQDETFSIRYGGGGVTPLSAELLAWQATYKSAVLRCRRFVI